MIRWIVFFYFIAEVLGVTYFIERYSFVDFVWLTISSGCLGLIIFNIHGRSAWRTLQASLQKGEMPASQMIHRFLIILGAIFIMLPGIVNDLFGVFLILPGFRHVMAFWFSFLFKSNLGKNFQVFTNFGGGGFRAGGGFQNQRQERDVKNADVLDITPQQVTRKNIDS